jgi:hypothetical protein
MGNKQMFLMNEDVREKRIFLDEIAFFVFPQ